MAPGIVDRRHGTVGSETAKAEPPYDDSELTALPGEARPRPLRPRRRPG